MKRIYFYCFIFLIAVNTIFASWYVLHGDIFFTSDIARDFHLLRELDEKKIMLIGPRSSGNLYHGPLWSYLNYPAFVLGNGNPIIVGWFWVILALLATILSFFIGKALFSKNVGLAYALMISVYLTFHTRGMSHPHGAMILIPLWFFCFVRYVTRHKIVFLIAHVALSGILVQFELAPGLPLAILTVVAILYLSWKRRTYSHVLALLIFPLVLANFIVFDFRHDHIFFQKILGFVTPYQGGELFDYTMFIKNRLVLMFSSPEILRRDPGGRNMVLFFVMLGGIAIQLRDRKHIALYLSFLYFYVGFFVLSFIDKGPILYFHQYPLFLLVFLVFSSLLTSRYKKAFSVLFILVYAANTLSSFGDARDSSSFIGIHKYSWKFLSGIAKQVYEGPENEFGYFVYSPDVLAYEPKYAMWYMGRQYPNKKRESFRKLPVTYVIAAPHPPADPYMLDEWWRTNQVKIAREPNAVTTFDNGYKIEKYYLTSQEQAIPFDPAIDPGIHFR
ncbi:hypothetical protein HY410_00300 [Candidatus Gottesmanbacteria bacterium]|nr:hypothetical protein [Candidatus Gottesmanbacteria bacterium]